MVPAETILCMRKITRFFAEAGALGVGGVLFAFVLWGIALLEHAKNKNIPALWLLLGGCIAFSFGAFMAWSKADDRANERMPKLGFSGDGQGFYLTHLEGEAARFIRIEPLVNPRGTKLHFDPVDFLGGKSKIPLNFRLEILPQDKNIADMGKALAIMFSAHSKDSASYPIKIRFRWNRETLEEKVVITWIVDEKRFETLPPDTQY